MGVTPLGGFTGEFEGPLPFPPVIRADKIDARTQEFEKLTEDRDPVDAAVIEMLWRVRGTGAVVRTKGARFLDVDKLNDRAANRLKSEAQEALAPLVKRRDITILTITVEIDRADTSADLTVAYLNNRRTSNKRQEVRRRVPEAI